jgi:hypothetical protein
VSVVTRPWAIVTIIALVILAFTSLPVVASKPYTCSYTLKAASPVDDPSTGYIEARPGMAITIEADVSGTYSGPISITIPSFNVNLKYELKHDGNIIDTKDDSYTVSSMRVKPGMTYSQTGSRSYMLPSDLAPGDYTLECTADVSILGIGKTEHASFPIKVLGEPSSNAPASQTDESSTTSTTWSVPITYPSLTPANTSQDQVWQGFSPLGMLKFIPDGPRQII